MSVWLHLKPKNVGKGREREKIKIIVLFCSYPTRNRNFQKNSKTIQRIKKSQFGYIISQNSTEKNEKKSPLWYHFKPKFFGKCQEREKIKIIVSFRPYLTHNLKFQKNCKKIKKNTIMASFEAKIVWNRPRKVENKNYLFVEFLADAL